MGFFNRKKVNKVLQMDLAGVPGTTQTDKCLLMAAEKDVVVNLVLGGGGHLGGSEVPLLTEGSTTVKGTSGILAYLDVRGKGGQLNPKKAAFLGHQNYWGQVAIKFGEPAVNCLMHEIHYGPIMDNDHIVNVERCSMAEQELEQALFELDKQLEDKSFIVGEYSYADIHWTTVVHLCELLGKLNMIIKYCNVERWYDRVKARSSFDKLPTLDEVKQQQLRFVA